MMTATASLDTRLTAHSASALGVFRILTGLMFTMHGTVKLFGWPTGSPAAMAAWPMWWAGVLEVILGVLVAIGWYARAAVPPAPCNKQGNSSLPNLVFVGRVAL